MNLLPTPPVGLIESDRCYPPDAHSDRYHLLLRVPPETRADMVARADAGLPLTDEQAAMLGLTTRLQHVLLPDDPEATTQAQREALFCGGIKALRFLLDLAYEREWTR